MIINELKLKNFRNHKDQTFSFAKDYTLIFGQNGSGKTNILEAIHLMSTTKSLRAQYDREIISHDEDFTRIESYIGDTKDSHKLEMIITKSETFDNKSSKKVRIDGTTKSITKFMGKIKSILFTPHDIEIFTQSPSVRRKYIDLLFYQVDEEYKRAHSIYNHVIKQRNKVLEEIRDFRKGTDEIDFWTDKILETGTILQKKRAELFDFVQQNISEHADKLNVNHIDYRIEYKPNVINTDRLQKYKDIEIAAAKTLIGPHRDDFDIYFNGYNVGKFGSRGQKRSTLLAFKLCEIDYISKISNTRPILLLDDIFSELDDKHKQAIENIVDMQQTIITSADKSILDDRAHTITL